ncbi:MAG: hypothetical protein ACFCBW_18335, partial [Candidatus Competibacterales bacterium]
METPDSPPGRVEMMIDLSQVVEGQRWSCDGGGSGMVHNGHRGGGFSKNAAKPSRPSGEGRRA